MQLVLFNLYIGPYLVLPFRATVNLGAMTMKGCPAFHKAPASLETHHQIILCHIQDTHLEGFYLSVEVQSVYYTTPADWVKFKMINFIDTLAPKTLLFQLSMKYLSV